MPRETRFSERATDWVARQLGGDRSAYNRARDTTGLMDFLPGYGDAVAADEAGAAYRAGNYGEASLLGGAAMLGVVPGAGDAAAQVIRKGVRAAKNAPRAISDARRITVPEDRQGLIWTPMSAGEKNVGGGELSKTAPLVDPADMSATVVPTGDLLPRTIVQPEDLQGSILSPAIGDRTAAGGLLTEINDAPLANPVLLEGGPDFMRGPASQADDVIWASNQSPMTKLSNQAQELGETGKDINFVYTASGGRNADFSTMMSDALIEQLPAAKVTKKNKQSFDREMKAADQDWPGIDSPNLSEYLRNATGDKRKAFVEKIALGKYQKAGMPDIVSTRFAITEPELLGLPTGASGYAISRMDPSGRLVTDPTVPHTTYPVQLGGKGYVGGLLDNVPREVMFPDFYATRRAAGIPTRGDDRSFMSRKVYQDANQQWLDNVMQYLQGIQRAN